MNLQTVRTVCKELGVSEATVRRAIAVGRIQVLMLGNRQLVDLDTARERLQAPEGATIEEVSEKTGMSQSAIRRGIREGWLPAAKPGKAYLFDLAAVMEAIRERMASGKKAE